MAIPVFTMRVGRPGNAIAHYAYICREGVKEEEKEALVWKESGNIPDFAESPSNFWKASDLRERRGLAYREIMLALPMELSVEQNLELVRDFVSQILSDRHPYSFAVHAPETIDGRINIHAHIMFSERRLDGIKRSEEQFFKRFDKENPELGGARKRFYDGEGYMSRRVRAEKLKELRLKWQEVCNRHLERAGSDARIDMRSYKERGITKAPEPHLLPSQVGGELHREIVQYRSVPNTASEMDRILDWFFKRHAFLRWCREMHEILNPYDEELLKGFLEYKEMGLKNHEIAEKFFEKGFSKKDVFKFFKYELRNSGIPDLDNWIWSHLSASYDKVHGISDNRRRRFGFDKEEFDRTEIR